LTFWIAAPLRSPISKTMWVQLRLFQRRTAWVPTLLGWIGFALVLLLPIVWWWTAGESFLSSTSRLSAEILVVEGWIGRDGVRAAAIEFKEGGYQYIVTTGGMPHSLWEDERESYALMAERELLQSGISETKIIVATPSDTKSKRTFESAVAVWHALQARGIRPKRINLFTSGPHARRSRLVFAKVDLPETEVGVIDWTPGDDEAKPWWRSSERAKDLLSESAGYLFEALFNSGRRSNSPSNGRSPGFAQNRDGAPQPATP
jgi:uncharacterized SAM-binding protein YcdF (DUF218 family)